MAEILTATHKLRIRERLAYMIERRPNADPAIKSPGPHWIECFGHAQVGPGGIPNFKWTSNPHTGLQFARREDAQCFLDFCGSTTIDELNGISNRSSQVTEHIFEEIDNG